MKAPAQLPMTVEPKQAAPLPPRRRRPRGQAEMLNKDDDARMRPALAERATRPVQARATVDFGYGDLIAEARAPALPGADPTGMPAPVRAKMENAFRADFSDVRVHPGSEQAERLRALAFTQGSEIHVAPGQWAPETTKGQALLGHELTHVVQQRSGRVKTTAQLVGVGLNDEPALEAEADLLGMRAAGGDVGGQALDLMHTMQPSSGPAMPVVQRAPAGQVGACDAVDTAPGDPSGTGVPFGWSSEALTPAATAAVEGFATAWKNSGGTRAVVVDGYASTDGDPAYNLGLSCRRALTTKKVLADKGVSASLMTTKAHGETTQFGASLEDNRRAVVREIAPKAPTLAPSFAVVGTPQVKADKDDQEFNSTMQVNLFMGDFSIKKAVVSASAAQPADFDDWEVGIVQHVASPTEWSCFRYPSNRPPPPGGKHAGEVWVDQTVPQQFIHPDRAKNSNAFYQPFSKEDLAQAHKGRTSFSVTVEAEDHPRFGSKSSVLAITGNTDDSGAQIFRGLKFGFFQTYVIARRKSGASVIPLYIAEWYGFASADYASAGTGIDFQSSNVRRRFELVSHHVFGAQDMPPVLTGTPVAEIVPQQGWRKSCPSF